MATLKVFDGTAWNVVAGQGAPGQGVPPGGTTNQALVKTSAADYAVAWQTIQDPTANWSTYTPRFATEPGSEGGMTPGTGGGLNGYYKMIAPYTMAIYIRFTWGTTGGNGGTGNIMYGMPMPYTTTNNNMMQYLDDFVWCGDATFYYSGFADVIPNTMWIQPRAPHAYPDPRYIGSQRRVCTSTMYPELWYPAGGLEVWGVLHVNQQW